MPKEPSNFRLIPCKGIFGGVFAGIAYYLEIPLWIIRLAAFILWAMAGTTVVFVYLLLWGFVPNIPAPKDFDKRTE